MTTARKEKLSNWAHTFFSSFGRSQASGAYSSRMDKLIIELVKGTKSKSEKEAFLDWTSRVTLTILFALSSSIAVLRNTYSNYEDYFDVGCDDLESDEKNEVLQMMHFQFMKIYELQQAYQFMTRLFRNFGSRRSIGVQKRSQKNKKRRLLSRSATTAEKTVRFFDSAWCNPKSDGT